MGDGGPLPLVDGDAVILAGGRSSRMGTDKALLEVGGVSLLERLISELRRVFRRVHLSIDPARPYPRIDAPRIPDLIAGRGPLEGVRAALESLRAPALFAAVDLPVFSPYLAQALWTEGTAEGRRGAVPRWAGGLEPAFAVYGPDLLEKIRGFLDEGQRELRRIAALPGVLVLDLEDERTRRRIFPGSPPDPGKLFRNLNTPADLRTFREI